MKHAAATTILTLLALLCTVKALGQEPSSGHAQHKQLAGASTSTTTVHGEPGQPLPSVLNIDHSDLGALARQLRAERVMAPKATMSWEQDDHGKVVPLFHNPDIWLYSQPTKPIDAPMAEPLPRHVAVSLA